MSAWLRDGSPELRRQLLLGAAFLVPLLVLRDLNDPVNVPKLSLLIVIVSVVAALRACELLQGIPAERMKTLLVPVCALAAPLTLGWLFSPYKHWSLLGVYPRYLGLLPYLIVMLFGVLVVDAFRDASPIAWTVTAAGALAGTYALIQWLGLDPFEWGVGDQGSPERYVVATLGNPNFAGAWLGATLPVAAALFVLDRSRRPLSGAAAFLIAAGWVVARSEVAWVAGVAGVVVWAGWTIAARRDWTRFVAMVAAGLIGLGVVAAISATILGADIPRLATAERRGDWWQAALDMAADSPLVGRGPNAFALEHSVYRTQGDATTVGFGITDDPHSVPLSLLTGAGITGLLGFFVLAGWIVRSGFSAAGGPSLAAGFLGSAIAYLVQSLASIDTVALRTALWTAVAGLVVATAVPSEAKSRAGKAAASTRRGAKQKRQPIRNPVGMGAALLVGLCGVTFAANLLLNDAQFAHGNALFRDGDLNAAQAELDSSLGVRREIAYRRAYGNLLGTVAQALEDDGAPFIEQARSQFSFIDEVPHVNSIVDYARILRDRVPFDVGVADDAVALYLRATRLDPRNPELLTEAAFFLVEQEAFEEVVRIVQPRARVHDRAGLWGSLALAQVKLGDAEEARTAIDAALALDPAEERARSAQDILNGAAD